MPRSAPRSLALAATLLVAAAICATTPTAATAAPSCKPPGARTVTANREALVYEVRDGETTQLWGCRRATGRRTALADAFDDDYVSSSSYALVRLRGHMVAFGVTAFDISCKGACPPDYQPERRFIEVVDLRRSRVVRVVRDAIPLDLAVTTRGGVAWTRTADVGVIEVLAADSWGRRVLDRGAIDARSLTSELTIVRWLHDGAERFSRLR